LIKLESDQYFKVIDLLQSVEINTLFAQSVLNQKVSGSVFVDNELNPETFYISHSYGMSLLFGNINNEEFNIKLKEYMLNSKNNVHKRNGFRHIRKPGMTKLGSYVRVQ